ncbi:hypothetical protein [Thalassobacillus sp. CUG 92003]|uniref:hypothetical protein n=1 Tax=Thalassobacillus sp. CUG 92003 TaxID=2736641 RepID=UPI0015E7D572|nr:hypothetical protein [Thalassobacillus sp. CUG 92003]
MASTLSMKACYKALYVYKTEIVEDNLSGVGVRFSYISNGVVGKLLRDSRGNGLAGKTPQDEVRRGLPPSPQESE